MLTRDINRQSPISDDGLTLNTRFQEDVGFIWGFGGEFGDGIAFGAGCEVLAASFQVADTHFDTLRIL